MGAKFLEDPTPGGNGGTPPPPIDLCSSGGEPRGTHLARDGHGALEGDGGNDDEDDDDDDQEIATAMPLTTGGGKRKKKRKPRKKKKKKAAAPQAQSSPPRVPLADLFPSGEYPAGELLRYAAENTNAGRNTARTTAAELRYLARQKAGQNLEDPAFLNDYRKAAEVHRQVRRWVQETVRPGQTLADVGVGIEDGVRALLGNAGLEPGDALRAGMGFPTGLCLNHVVAHYTPNPGQKDVVLQERDVMKVDFGVHVNGWIVDSAFTMSFDPTYDNLLAAVKRTPPTPASG
ncbi:hypothetical protein VTK26DRAFT_827 [Humicola hyalothermophila]